MTGKATHTRRVELLPLAELAGRTNPQNPKAHALGTIDASVSRFGYVEPVVLDERTGRIVSGHGRTQTLADMHARGETPPEGIERDKTGGWLVPVVRGWASATDAEANAALISLNRSTEMGGWDDTALLELLHTLEDVEDGFAGVGFDMIDLDNLQVRLDSMAEVDRFTPGPVTDQDQPHGGSGGEPGTDGLIERVGTELDDRFEVVVVFPRDRYGDFYNAMSGIDWVIDVRDRIRQQ